MKTLTKNFLHFAVVFLIGAILFRFGLSYFLENKLFSQGWVFAGAYFFFNFVIAWYFGKKDYEILPLYNLGFRLDISVILTP